jgi:cephalosporin hydroxylase
MPTREELLEQIKTGCKRGEHAAVLELADRLLGEDAGIPELQYLRCICLRTLRRYAEALAAAQAELARDPSHAGALREARSLEPIVRLDAVSLSGKRTWETLLTDSMVQAVQRATFEYSYRGIPMVKNPYDLAIYPMLLWNVKPATIIEIGSYAGGSALWLADTMQNFGMNSHVYSIDIKPVTSVIHPRVTFLQGNGRELGTTLTSAWMDSLRRPLLVIEDADHQNETTRAVLEFFHPHIRNDEFVIVEDTILETGARDAISEFMRMHPGMYDIDRKYCDFFGYNVTWNFNGFLRKISAI